MKVLLDENIDHRLRRHLGSHDIITVSFRGWDGLKNGKLLDVAERDGFEVLITGDQTIFREQNLTRRRSTYTATSADGPTRSPASAAS
ncbi:MAG: DUF5615 family PIN-like protein [Bryobacterales bacterium]|nr:DUF5615 family PIN-like protein [Bryobacterales bacterium]